MSNLSTRIIKARERKNLRQYQLADLVGVTQQSMQMIEAGKTYRPRQIKSIARVLGVLPEWLEYGSNPPEWEDKNNENIYECKIQEFFKNRSLILIEVKDHAMESDSKNKTSINFNEIAIVDTDIITKNGDIIAAIIKNKKGIIIRNYISEENIKILKSNNLDYPTISIDKVEKIIGVVIKKIKNI